MDLVDSSPNLRRLFRRCLKCPQDVIPQCSPCAADETCSLVLSTCDQCASATCVKNVNASGGSGGSTTNTGAIAGGVIGAIALVAIFCTAVYCVLKRKRRNELPYEEYIFPSEEIGSEKGDGFTHRSAVRGSTHTMASVASTGTALTRASNVIHIAYIPGVTNRSSSAMAGAPPVPFGRGSAAASPQPNESDHFFGSKDLHRGSAYHDASRAPRASVASTVYRNNAVVSPVPAQTVIRGRAAMVSVRNNGNGSTTPESVPAFHHELEGDSPRLDAEPMTLDIPGARRNRGTTSRLSTEHDNQEPRDPFGTPPSSVSSVSGDSASQRSGNSGNVRGESRASSRQTTSRQTNHEELPANEPVMVPTNDSRGYTSEQQRRMVASAAAAASSTNPSATTITPITARSSNYSTSPMGPPSAKRRSNNIISPAASSSGRGPSNLGAVIEDPVAAVIQEATSKASEEPTVGLGRVVQGPFSDEHEIR